MRKDVEIVNTASNVAVVTLWTKKEVVVERLEKLGVLGKVYAVGTLYTKYGVNYLLHTLSTTPQVDVLVVFGADLMGSGEALVKLFKGEVDEGLKLLWSLEELKPLLSSVRVVDLREAFKRGDWGALARAIEENYRPGARRPAAPLRMEEVELESWPLQVAGLYVQETSLFRAWVKLVDAVMTWGFVKGSEYGERQRQLLGAVVVLDASQPLDERVYRYFPREDFERQAKSILEGEEGAVYSYGDRLRRHREAGDQVRRIVERLASSPDTRRAIALTWDFATDTNSQDPPCLVAVQGDLSGDTYNQVAFFRSHDAYAAWPLNAYGLLALMRRVAGELSERTGRAVKPGWLVVYSSSLHVYEHDWGRALRLVQENAAEARGAFVPDNKGNFLVRVEGGRIVAELRTPDGRLYRRYEGGSASEVLRQVGLDALMPGHAAYLSRELYRAEKALREGGEYVQDAV
ncbi:thymidylate synthase [Thermofilum pendens]|uniref:Thymidylate synthase-like protein n=1 Tax=Thermofilum pendens (strain DSM 2475 / Hrk 5) TaxID=368408 RepID=A1RYR8_THEPD|nr:thymidylate synthase [Thermofilum pendens]ABL78348.1 Thymidylate synthase-like protein [Thermofilum pendens Hrk 5]